MGNQSIAKKKGYEALDRHLCGGCKYFRQHYVKLPSEYYVRIEYGHCVYPRLKKRREDETCPHWEAAATPKEETL